MQDIVKLMQTSFKASANYVNSRIMSDSQRNAYKMSARYCLSVMSEDIAVSMIKKRISSHRDEAKHLYPSSLFRGRENEIHYHNLAITHALDVISKLEMRFITGGCDSEPRNYKNKELYVYYDEDLFKTT